MSESSARLRIVVDTNLFVSSAISPTGAPRRLLQTWYAKRIDVVFSTEQYHDLIDVLRRPKLRSLFRFSAHEFAEFFAALTGARRIEPTAAVPVPVRDPKDVPILGTALGGHAEYLVTGDADLLALRNDARLGTLQIVTVNEVLAILDQLAPDRSTDG